MLLVAATLGLIVLYAFFRRAPRTWWLWGTALGVLFQVLAMLVAPVFVAPLFNTYKPLTDPKISQPILAMAAANEIPVQQVFEVDASRQSNRVSANVSGLFGTARISLNDNLLKQCTLPEIRMVMAHEMGHYVLNHGIKLILYFGLFIFGAFAFSRVLFERIVRSLGREMGRSWHYGSRRLSLAHAAFFNLLFPYHSRCEHGSASDGARGRCLRDQHRP